MTDEPRWDLIDKIPDDMRIYSSDHSEGQWTWAEWREALGHPYAHGHGFCRKCGAGGPCELAAFYDAVMVSTVRELDAMGALVPRETSRPRIMGLSEAAECLDVSRQFTMVLRKTDPSFPAVLDELMSGPVWLAEEMEHYAATRNRTPGRKPNVPRETSETS